MRRKNFTGAVLLGAGAYYLVRTHEPLSGTGNRAIAPTPTPVAPPPPTLAPVRPPETVTDDSTLGNVFATVQSLGHTIMDAIHTGVPWIHSHWEWLILGVVLIFVLGYARDAMQRNRKQDPQRAFTKTQRAEGFERAGQRCEMSHLIFFRCRGPAEHADHHNPWSKGGASDMRNLVAACAPCNLKKGARVPTRHARRGIERRRRGYFPPGEPVFVGSRYQICGKSAPPSTVEVNSLPR